MLDQKRIYFKVKEFSRFERTVGEQRSSEPVVIQQLAWEIVVKCEVDKQSSTRYLGFYVQCNSQDSHVRISDWNCVADVILQVLPYQRNICPVQEKIYGHQFSIGNGKNCYGNPRMVTMEKLMFAKNGWYNAEQDNILLEAIITAKPPYFQFHDWPLQPLAIPPKDSQTKTPVNRMNDIYKLKGSILLKIEKLSEFASEAANGRRLSDAMHIQGLPWNILAISSEKYLGFYLQCNVGNEDVNWSCAGSATMHIVAQKEQKKFIEKVWKFTEIFHAQKNQWGFSKFITFGVLMDSRYGWYDEENDSVILSVDVTAYTPHGIKTSASVVDRMLYLLSSGKGADVHFLVGIEGGKEEHFTAHKGILATLSDVFDRMFDFDTNLGNSDKVIIVTDVKPDAFRVMLNFIYTTNLGGLNQENVFDVLHAANKYDVTELIDACANCPKLDVGNVLQALGKALLYGVKSLADRCWKFIDQEAGNVLENEKFVDIDQSLLCLLFARDELTLYNVEIVIWNAALRWADAQCHKHNMEITGDNRRKVLGPALFHIRFPLIPKEQFASLIVPTKLLTNEEMLSVLLYHANPINHIPNDEFPLEFSTKIRASTIF